MGGNPPEHLFRQADVLGDQAFIALASNLPQRQPHLEGAKSARILRSILVVVQRFFACVELIIGRVVGKGILQGLPVAYQRTSCF